MCVSDALAQVPIEHYVKKLKEHEEKGLSFNERMAYWEEYKKSLSTK
jgi:hypothetical protein|tara:strand:- start:467 stop:607 length:141 start_codon:yes stop_codon:yes gene_type:complete